MSKNWKSRKNSFLKPVLVFLFGLYVLACNASNSVLVFSKTECFRHKSIETGVKTIQDLGMEHDFKVTHTEDADMFSKVDLEQFHLIIFLNTTGDVLNSEQETAFKNYINNGGSFMGIHSATDTEFDWEWYGKLVGAYFLNHPKQAEATMNIIDGNHLSTKHLLKEWVRFDEWYNFKNISENINVLLRLDESSYEGGEHGDFHPIAWYQEFDGGKMFYTGMGHTEESYAEPEFRQHLLGGILYCLER